MADKLQQGKFDSFTIVNNGLIETDLLTEHEKMVYIVIRKHLNQEKQTAFPGMATIARESRISKSQVLRAIKGLEEKGLLLVGAGHDVIRFVPALIAEERHIDAMIEILDKALTECE